MSCVCNENWKQTHVNHDLPAFWDCFGCGGYSKFSDLVRLGFCEGESILTVKETVHSRTRYGVHEQYEPNSVRSRQYSSSPSLLYAFYGVKNIVCLISQPSRPPAMSPAFNMD